MTTSEKGISVHEFRRIKSRENKELNLFTGLYYRLSVKSIPNGLMTFEPEPREEGHLIQLALNDMEAYDPDGSLRGDSLWTILPEVGSKENDYQLKAMSHPEGSVTYTHGTSWGGRYMELDLKNPEHYDPGANMHSSALWHFQLSELPDYLTIHNSDERRYPNFVTFSNEPSDRGQLMQIGTKELDHYDLKGSFRHDALWSFKPTNYLLSARVTDFKFDIPSDSDISEAAYPIRLFDNIVTENNRKVDFSEEIPEMFNLSFLQSFKIFPADSMSIDSTSLLKIPFLSGKSELIFDKKSNTQWAAVVNTKYNVVQEFLIPEGCTKLKVKGYCSFVKCLEVPFVAVVEVRAKADCADSVDGMHREMLDICDLEVIEHLLKVERFTAKLIPRKKTTGKGVRDDTVVLCQVSGTLKCTCGMDTYLDVKAEE